MTSMKIVQFLRPPTPLSIYVQNSSFPLDVQFLNKSIPSPNDNKSIKRKHNPRMTIICYHVLPSGQFCFQYQPLNLVCFFFDIFHLVEASLSAFLCLFTFECAVVQKYHEISLFTIIHYLSFYFVINFIYTT